MIKRSANRTDVVFIQREFLKSLKTSGMEHVRARQKNCGPRWIVTYVDSFIAQRHDTNWTIGNRSLNRLFKKKKKKKEISRLVAVTSLVADLTTSLQVLFVKVDNLVALASILGANSSLEFGFFRER